MPTALLIAPAHSTEMVYGPEELAALRVLVDLAAPPLSPAEARDQPDLLKQAEILLSTWGAPRLDEAFLEAAPRLKLFLYGAGTIRGFMTEAAWDRGLIVCSAAALNAVPVAEYTLAALLLGLKRAWSEAARIRAARAYGEKDPIPGNYGTTIGLVSYGAIARLVRQHLRPFDHRVVVYDPFLSDDAAAAEDVERVSLEELFQISDAVSIHTPWLKETEGLISEALIRSMKAGATLINTSRGAVVNEPGLGRVLAERPDLQAILDVTHPEPPAPDSPLFTLPNVFLTPHLAGSVGPECRRMGRAMIDELRRYLTGEPLRHQVTREQAAVMA
ncbi:MAG: glycerate dehydrogenase [Puniceicoccaceae bacterium]|nr:MAG: glycerate dehydrogenase [Puniceicoccaceae bacterium]